MQIAGRHEEIALLTGLLDKNRPEFVAIYGRRRVGKTYLIRQVYKDQIVFECSGLHKKSFSQQLENFWLSLQEYKSDPQITPPPKTWLQAFSRLKSYLNTLTDKGKKVIFLDEIPWFETPRSGFLAALDNFWNQYCSKREDIILVICGSAASWIIKKVINDRGGLHNRITTHIRLMPFTLLESREFLALHQVHLTDKDICQLYMSLGGIPFYLKDVKPGKSVPQILDDLFFHKQALLKREFQNLYASLFRNSELHEKIVAVLAERPKGLTRKKLIKKMGISSGGGISLALKELVECGFIIQEFSISQDRTQGAFRLVDEYTLFYFKFLASKGSKTSWQKITEKNTYKIWLGFAFENLCAKHIMEIKQVLGIQGVITEEYSWSYKGNKQGKGAQIDLVIDRSDNCINLVECKYHNKEFMLNKEYTNLLSQKIQIFKEQSKTKKNLFFTFLTVYGVQKNKYYLSLAANQLRVEDLFIRRNIIG